MSSRCCPACSRRWTQLIDPDCPVCAGQGVLHLGAGGVAQHGAEVASRAVEYALEGQARRDLASPHSNVQVARDRLADAVAKLRAAGLLARDRTPVLGGRRPATANQVHQRAVAATPGYRSRDAKNLDRPALDFTADDRPLAAGGIPGFSLGLYVCNLARAADPLDPLATSVRDVVTGRFVSARRAETLARSIPLFDEKVR